MGAENVFRTLNIKEAITYSKEILIFKTFFLLIVITQIELISHT